jgi:glyceraldehyde-3-phosphate dehydrogenase type I
MTIKVAINGFGRIGRNVLRAHYEDGKKHDIQFVAINDLGNAPTNAHLLKYDTAHGKFPGTVAVEGDNMVVNGDKIRVLAVRNPAELPWKELGVDVVLECTGLFTTKEKAGGHIKAGAKKVIISAPGGKDVDATIVYGVNHKTLKASDTVISNASCTLGAAGEGAARSHRRGLGSDDHRARVHQRSSLDGRLSRRSAPRALGDAVDDPHEDRGGGGGWVGVARVERQA